MLIFVYDWQLIELVVPDEVVGFWKCSVFIANDELFEWCHEVFDFGIAWCAGKAIVTAGDNPEQLAVWRTIFGNCHGAVTGFFTKCQHISKSICWAQVGIGDNETCLVVLYFANHSSLAFDGLRAKDEGKTAFFSQCDGQGIVGNSLHDSGYQWNIQGNGRFFAFLEFNQWGF